MTTYTYTDRGDVATETDAEGYTISYVYDGNHNMVKKTTVDGDTTYVYDELDRLISTTTPDGKTETMEYDGLGRVTSVTDKGGHKTQYVYDAAGNVIQTIDAKGNVAAFEYDLMGNLTKVTLHRVDTQDGVDEYEVTLYEYDGRGLVTKVVDALGNVTTTEYDGNGNVSKVTDADGYVTEYTYNALDMVTNINYNGGKEASYQYNAVGDLVRMEDWTGINTFEVDLLNRITKVTDHKGKVVTYGYDATGNQTSIGYPDGSSVTKTYDLVNNLESVTETDGRTTTYTYDGMRRVIHMEYPDGWQEDYTYDAIGQLLSIYDTDPSGKDMKQQKNRFEYDACGNMTYEYMRGNGTGEATVEVYYTYDELHQVVTAQENYGNKSRSYQYDSLGNLTWETNSNNVTVDYKLNNLNQITTSSDDGWKTSTTYTYDDRGNLIQELYTKNNKQSITGAYTFDETNKMVKGVNDLGESSEYLYNGLGALVTNTWTIKKNAYGYHDVTALVTTTMVEGEIVVDKQTGKKEKKDKKDPEVVLTDAELNKTSTVVKDFVIDYTVETMDPLYETESTTDGLEYRYVYGLNDVRLSVTVKGVENGAGHIIENGDEIRLYYHQDLRGTVDYLTSPVSGKVESWTHYNEWGEITHNAVLKCGQRELDLVKNYTGHEYDAVLGMYYAKARFYDAEDRHFISIDPVMGRVEEPLSFVQYTYVVNNPLIFIDPLGKYYILLDNQGNYYAVSEPIGYVAIKAATEAADPSDGLMSDAFMIVFEKSFYLDGSKIVSGTSKTHFDSVDEYTMEVLGAFIEKEVVEKPIEAATEGLVKEIGKGATSVVGFFVYVNDFDQAVDKYIERYDRDVALFKMANYAYDDLYEVFSSTDRLTLENKMTQADYYVFSHPEYFEPAYCEGDTSKTSNANTAVNKGKSFFEYHLELLEMSKKNGIEGVENQINIWVNKYREALNDSMRYNGTVLMAALTEEERNERIAEREDKISRFETTLRNYETILTSMSEGFRTAIKNA